mmetsp:Transcript_13501/g.27564  ORF Transcript_13501/g.27564 Transcript_13501/m.27564 type:complete len:233 (+) Transcript_13501:392-1090(+)
MCKRLLNKFTYGGGLSGGENVIVGSVVLKHHPHPLDVIASMSPITFGVNVSEVQALVQPFVDAGDSHGNFTGDKCGPTTGRLVVEENSVGEVHSVSLAVVHKNPEGILLCNGIRRTGVERSRLGLRDLLHLSVKLTGGSLVEASGLLESTGTNGIEHTKDAHSITIGSVLWHVKGHLHVTHSTKVVDFVGLDIGNDCDQVGGIAKITIVKEKLDSGLVAVTVNVVDAPGIER